MENYVSHLVYIDLDFDVAVYDETYKEAHSFSYNKLSFFVSLSDKSHFI